MLLPLLGVSPIRQAAAPYSAPIIYLIMGGFMLALAMVRWERHVTLATLGSVGTRPCSLILGFLCAVASKEMGAALVLDIAYGTNTGGMGTLIGNTISTVSVVECWLAL